MVGVQTLGDSDESAPAGLECLDVVQAVHEGSAKPVELPDEDAAKPPRRGVSHQPGQPGPSCLRTAHHVLVNLHHAPTLLGGKTLEFPLLQLAILVGSADPGVQGNLDHRRGGRIARAKNSFS